MVRDWLGISARVGRPPRENPRRPVYGFACPRAEVSGRRLWGAIARLYGTPEDFFSRFFVANYCPLVFMEAGGRNLTPDKLRRAEKEALYAVCDEYLRLSLGFFAPRWVVGIGGFAARRAGEALAGGTARIASVLHPSPASPAANRDWAGAFERKLRELGLLGTARTGGHAVVRIKRIYEEPSDGDGLRVLVDRLWPRGVSKEAAKLDLWLREVAPSDGTRKWFGHDESRWEGFRARYLAELRANTGAVARLRELCAKGAVTLLYAASDPEHNNAVVLRDLLSGP
jgi:uncharacterized protein YeaO (DUF488 family)